MKCLLIGGSHDCEFIELDPRHRSTCTLPTKENAFIREQYKRCVFVKANGTAHFVFVHNVSPLLVEARCKQYLGKV